MSDRAQRAIALLDGAGVDALLVTNLVNVRYLTGYTGSNGLALIGESVCLGPILQGALPGLIKVSGHYEIVAFGAIVLLLLHFAPRGVTAALPQRPFQDPRLQRVGCET